MERVHPEGRRLSYEIADKIENLHFDGVYLLKESKDIIHITKCYHMYLVMLVLIIKALVD